MYCNGIDEGSRGRTGTAPAHPSHLNPAHADEAQEGRSTSRGRAFASSGRGRYFITTHC